MTGIHHRLKAFRHALGLTQAQMAELMDSSLRQYRRYESGEFSIPSEHLVPLAVSHQLDLNWLFTGEGQMRRSPESPSGKPAGGGLELLASLLQEYRRKLPGQPSPAVVRDIESEYAPDEDTILQALITVIRALYSS